MVFFFFNDTATTEIYTLSLHDALPISRGRGAPAEFEGRAGQVLWKQAHRDRRAFRRDEGADRRLLAVAGEVDGRGDQIDRKSTRLNSSHLVISYAVFCFKKKKKNNVSN